MKTGVLSCQQPPDNNSENAGLLSTNNVLHKDDKEIVKELFTENTGVKWLSDIRLSAA